MVLMNYFMIFPTLSREEDGEIGALILDDLLFPLWDKESVVCKADGVVKTISHKVVKGHVHENKSMPGAVKTLSRSDIIKHRALPLENCFMKERMLTFSVFILFFCASTAYQRMIST